MKKNIQILVTFILVLNLLSCNDLEEVVSNINFNTTQGSSIPVSAVAGTDVSFNESVSVDVENDDTREYLNSIQNVTVNRITYSIVNFTGDPNGSFVFDFVADGVIIDSQSIILKEAADSGVEYVISDLEVLKTIEEKLKNGDDVVFNLQGVSTGNEVMNFEFQFELNLKITTIPL